MERMPIEILQNLVVVFALIGIAHLFRIFVYHWSKKEEVKIDIKPELGLILFLLALTLIYSIFGFPESM
jgi:hypothetical protein